MGPGLRSWVAPHSLWPRPCSWLARSVHGARCPEAT